jgi:hypothetical protein
MSDNNDEWVLARFRDQLAETTDAETAIAAMPTPTVPDGGRAEEWVKPQLERATSVRDQVRIMAPGIVATGAVTAVWLSPIPVTGPLLAYGATLVGFGWWTTAGRPGPRETAVLVRRGVGTAVHWIAVLIVAAANLARRGATAAVRAGKNATARPAGQAG